MSVATTNPIIYWLVAIVFMVLLLVVVLTVTAYVVFGERVLLGRMQRRPGPNRVGPFGLMQSAADGIKLAFKESFIPDGVDLPTYLIAPAIAVASALIAYSVIPVGIWFGVYYWVSNVNIGILVVFAVSAMNVYAIVLGGYSSNSKYSLLGGLRSAAQLISYEMSLGLALVPTFLIVGSLRLQDIVNYHVGWFPGPLPLIILTPVGFLLYLVSAVAETNRAPFDLPEAEQELVGGFHTEYSGFKFAMYYIAEYMNMVTVSVLAAILFLAGWWGPWPIPPIIWLVLKVGAFLFLYIWLRATFPRLRYDMLMRLGWKLLLPVAMANVIVTAVLVIAIEG
ncbi:MAG: NADH-quinone oxidoreductase subunit NuoH [Candidatus Dormibacteraceae bacterium]